MFGMLDYRAHKLFKIILFIPKLIIMIISLFGLPIISIYLGKEYGSGYIENFLITCGSWIVLCLFFPVISWILCKLSEIIFRIFIDVVPYDGKNKNEARAVLYNGDKAIYAIELGKHPRDWRDHIIFEDPKLDWIAGLFYKKR